MHRPALFLGVATLCVAVGVASWMRHRSEAKTPSPPPVPSVWKPTEIHDPRTVSAPAPVVASPASTETAKALNAIRASHPAVAARQRALDEQVAKGDAGVAALKAACLARPHDDAVVADAIYVLHRIGTPTALKALEEVCRVCPSGPAMLDTVQATAKP